MAATANVREDASLLSRLDRRLHRLETGLALLAGIIILFMLGFSFVNILSRGLLNDPLNVYFDMARQSVILIAFLGLAYCQRNGGHIRMDMLIGAISGRLRWIAEFLSAVCIAGVVVFIGLGTMFDAFVDYREGVSSEDSRILLWPAKAVAVAMLWLMGLRVILQTWSFASAILNGREPVAVPLIESTEEQAAAEARTVQT